MATVPGLDDGDSGGDIDLSIERIRSRLKTMPPETAEQPAFRAAWHYRYVVVLGRPPNCGLHLGSVSRTDKPQ